MPIQRQTLFRPVSSDTGASRVYDVASDALDLFTAQGMETYQRRMLEEAETEGRAAGVEAGLAGEAPPIRQDDTLSASRYNAALAAAYGASIRTDVSRTVQEAQQAAVEADYDETLFNETLDAYEKGNMAKLDDRVAPIFQLETARLRSASYDSLVAEKQRVRLAEATAEIDAGLELTLGQAVLAAEGGDFESAAARMQEYQQLLSVEGSAIGLSRQELGTRLVAASNQLTQAAVMGEFRQADARGETGSFILDLLDGAHPVAADMTLEERGEIVEDIRGMLSDRDLAETRQVDRENREAENVRQQFLARNVDAEIEGTLTINEVRRQLRAGVITPADARSQFDRLASDRVGVSNKARLTELTLDPFLLSEQEILEETSLTRDDRLKLVQTRRKMLSDRRAWRAGQGAREGARRIRDGAGLIEGTSLYGADNTRVQAYTRAMRRFYDEVQDGIEKRGGLEVMTEAEIDELALATGEQVYQEDLIEFMRDEEMGRIRDQIDAFRKMQTTGEFGAYTENYVTDRIEMLRAELQELQQ